MMGLTSGSIKAPSLRAAPAARGFGLDGTLRSAPDGLCEIARGVTAGMAITNHESNLRRNRSDEQRKPGRG
jgi:hypothetical protein